MAASSATDTTSKTTEGTNSTTTEDCSIEDLQKEIEMLKKKIIDELFLPQPTPSRWRTKN